MPKLPLPTHSPVPRSARRLRRGATVAAGALLAAALSVSPGPAGPAAAASTRPPVVVSITAPPATPGPDPCAGSPADAVFVVGSCDSINSDAYGSLGTLSDEHSTILPPGTLGADQTDYLFFLASHTALNTTSSGLVVLDGAGPDQYGRWHLGFASGYGNYDPANPNPGQRFGQLFLSPLLHPDCPNASSAAEQNPSFDLNYADPGQVLVDPTQAPSPGGLRHLLMVYEGSNRCIGLTGGSNLAQGPPDKQGNPTANNFYSMVGIATSTDSGHSWPAYAYDQPTISLPYQSPNQGPPAGEATGVVASGLCMGNNCGTPLPSDYGRYAVLGPSTTVAQAMANPTVDSHGYLAQNTGDSAPSAFLDDTARSADPYLYVVNDYLPGEPALGDTPEPAGTDPNSDLVVSRAQLNGGAGPLAFSQWDGAAFGPAAGPGEPNTAAPSPIFQPGRADWTGSYENCEDAQVGPAGVPHQEMTEAQISYVDATHQYLLTFVCHSDNGDPATGADAGQTGASWFYATSSNLDTQKWSVPKEIGGSWEAFPSGSCEDFDGWYPSFMSTSTPFLPNQAGHLDTSGWVFYLNGCQGVGDTTPGGRKYSVRAFTIHIAPSTTLPE